MLKLLRNVSIKVKILLGFFIVAMFVVAIGILGTLSMESMAARTEKMYYSNLQGINELHIIKENLLNIRSELQRAVLFRDADKTKSSIANIQEYGKGNEELIDLYGKKSLSEEGNKIWNDFLSDMKSYQKKATDVIDLAASGKYDDAELKLNDVTKIREAMSEKINNLIELNENMAESENESNKRVAKYNSIFMYIIIGIGLILSVFIGSIISANISKSVKKALIFAKALSEWDLTVEVENKSRDELGKLIEALRQAQENMREIVSNIMTQTSEVSASSEELAATIEEINGSYEIINKNTSHITDSVMDIRAATEELNATIDQVNSGVTQLASNSSEGSIEAVGIKDRAVKIKEKGKESKELAERISIEKQHNIFDAIEKGKVVDEIANIAELISGIAGQTNLLALNASIEAARAGEHGKGFAVVASEIGTLADQSSGYVKDITEVVRSVKNAFENLADNSRDILEFVDGRVRKDYELLVDTGSNYEKDAVYVSGFSEDTAAMAEELNASTEEISGVIQTISGNIEDTSLSFEEISKNMNETTIAMNQIANAAENQAMVAEKLSSLVAKFKV